MADGEDRGLERRVFQLEQHINKLLMTTAVTEAKVAGIVSTLESRFKAFDHGQDLILERIKSLDTGIDLRLRPFVVRADALETRLVAIEEIKTKAAGALFMVRLMGITGIVGGIIGIIKLIKG